MEDHPFVVVLGVLASIATVLTALVTFDLIHFPSTDVGGTGRQVTIDTFQPISNCADPTISLSDGAGPSGTAVTIFGSGFPADEKVQLEFHTEALLGARTDADGAFVADVVIPGTFDAFAPFQFRVSATTTPTVCSASASFELTTA